MPSIFSSLWERGARLNGLAATIPSMIRRTSAVVPGRPRWRRRGYPVTLQSSTHEMSDSTYLPAKVMNRRAASLRTTAQHCC